MQREFDIKKFVEELIKERALTMEDGRERGTTPAVPVTPPEKPEERPVGRDDGDLLG